MKMMFRLLVLCVLASLGCAAQQTIIGGGTAASNPAYSCTPLTLAFGNQVVGTTSGQLSSVCTNTGNQILTVTSEVLTNFVANIYSFGTSNGCTAGAQIIPAGTCLVAVQFTPASATTYSSGNNVVVTITGATGSPQTITLTGTGVTSGGASGYTAPTAAAGVIPYTGFSPITSGQLPAEGGTVAEDQNFLHCVQPWSVGCASTSTSSGGISGSQFGAFIQCAGSMAAGSANTLDPTNFQTNLSWTSSNNTFAHLITPNDGWTVLRATASGAAQGGWGFYQINFAPGNSKCVLKEIINGSHLLMPIGSQGPVASHTAGSTDASLFYGAGVYTGPVAAIGKRDYTSGSGVTTILVSNLNSLSPQVCGETLGTGISNYGYLLSTNDAASIGHDNILMFAAGISTEGQNNWSCVVFYQVSSGAVAWFNTLTDACGSTTSPAWTGGWKSVSSGCTGFVGGHIHGLEEPDPSSTYIGIDDTSNSNQAQPLLFNMATQTAQYITAFPSGGHYASVASNIVSFNSGSQGTANSGGMPTTPFSSPTSQNFTAGRLGTALSGGTYQTDQHASGAFVSASGGAGTLYSLSYTGAASQCPQGGTKCPQPTGIGQQEVIMITPPPASGTWTPTFYRFGRSMNDCITDTNFYCTVGGNPSGDGKMTLITSNWAALLGNDNTGTPRKVVLLMELR